MAKSKLWFNVTIFLLLISVSGFLSDPIISSTTTTTTTVASSPSHNVGDHHEKIPLHRVTLTKDSSSFFTKDPKPILSAIDEQISDVLDLSKVSNSTKNSTCSEECKNQFVFENDDREENVKRLQCCITGCRYYTVNLILIQRNISLGYPTPLLVKTSSNESDDDDDENEIARIECFKSCNQAYQNDTKSISTCKFGCLVGFAARKNDSKHQSIEIKASTVGIPVKTVTSLDDEDNDGKPYEHVTSVPDNLDEEEKNIRKKLLSIMIPVKSMFSSSFGPNNNNGFDFNGSENSLSNMMANIAKSLSDHARRMMTDLSNIRQQQQSIDDNFLFGRKPSKEDDSQSSTKVQEGRFSFDPRTGESVSVQRSMSVMMAKDKDGHNRMVVMRQPPKITIHHGWNPFGLNFNGGFLKSRFFNKDNNIPLLKPLQFASDNEHETENEPFSSILQPSVIIKNKHNNGELKSSSGQSVFDDGDGQRDVEFERFFGIGPGQAIGIINGGEDQDEPFGAIHLIHRFSSLDRGLKNNFENLHNDNDLITADSATDSNWFSASPLFCLFILILSFIMFLYIIIWIFYYLPRIIMNKAKQLRQQRPNMPPTAPGGNIHRNILTAVAVAASRNCQQAAANVVSNGVHRKDSKETLLSIGDMVVEDNTKKLPISNLYYKTMDNEAIVSPGSDGQTSDTATIGNSEFPSPPPSYSSLVVADDDDHVDQTGLTASTKSGLPRYSQLINNDDDGHISKKQ